MTSPLFRRSFFRSSTGEMSPKLVEVDHPALAEPMRFVSDNEDMVYQGHVFKAMEELDVPFPTMRKGEVAQLQLVYSDMLNKRVELIRKQVRGPMDVTIWSIMRSQPDVIEVGPFYFKLRKSHKNDDGMMAGSLMLDDEVLNGPAQEDRYTSATSPGLF